jgi:hypothetical protein
VFVGDSTPHLTWPENPIPPALVVTILISQGDGTVVNKTRAFGAFKRDLRALVA